MTASVAAEAGADGPHLTVDAFFGGQVEVLQPARRHHRAGLEAVLLAAALPAATKGLVVDLGAGAGVAGLCTAARLPQARVLLVEREADLCAAARAALALPANGAFADRVAVAEIDFSGEEGPRQGPALRANGARALIMNPPFHVEGRVTPPEGTARMAAHLLAEDGLDLWFRTAARLLAADGELVAIARADMLYDVLAAARTRFGDIDVLPVQPRASLPAHRILVRGRKGRRGPLRILPQMVLHDGEGGRPASALEPLFRDGAGLGEVHPSWAPRDSDQSKEHRR